MGLTLLESNIGMSFPTMVKVVIINNEPAEIDVYRKDDRGYMVEVNAKKQLKGMVHMITMLTYIAQMDIGEYNKPF